jgi:putative Mg2+ transporter-C (MgtC) family protein
LIGGFTGLERERSRQFAGFRTHILVAIGACVSSIMSVGLFEEYYNYTNMDPARLSAQVLSGVGFLGAGAILKTANGTKGLTTAAGIWATASIGIAVGYGYYELSICAWLFVMITLYILKKIDKTMFRKRTTIFDVKVNDIDIIPIIYSEFEKSSIEVKNLEIEPISESQWQINFFLTHDRRLIVDELVKRLNDLKCIVTVHFLD